MSLKEFKRTDTGNDEVRDLQLRLKEFFDQFKNNPLLTGRLIENLAITSGTPLVIDHKLNRTPVGFLVIQKNANSVIWHSSITSTTLTLNASANVNIVIWVF